MEESRRLANAFSEVRDSIPQHTSGIEIDEVAFEEKYLPLLVHYVENQRAAGGAFLIGVQGSQGVGKTTLTTLTKLVLDRAGYRVAGFSIDDL